MPTPITHLCFACLLCFARGMAEPLKHHSPRVTVLNFVVLGQIMWATVRGTPKIGVPQDGDVPDTLQTQLSRCRLQCQFDRCWPNGTSVRMENYWKNWNPRVPPFKVTRVHQNRTDRSAAYDFLLTFNSNGLVL